MRIIDAPIYISDDGKREFKTKKECIEYEQFVQLRGVLDKHWPFCVIDTEVILFIMSNWGYLKNVIEKEEEVMIYSQDEANLVRELDQLRAENAILKNKINGNEFLNTNAHLEAELSVSRSENNSLKSTINSLLDANAEARFSTIEEIKTMMNNTPWLQWGEKLENMK